MSKIPFKRFGVMLDMSRNAVMNLPSLKAFVTEIAAMGYNTLFLYTEDTYEIPGEPYFGHQRGRYSQDEIRRIVAFCEKKGVEVIPCIQTLAHMDCFVKWKAAGPITDIDNILLAEDERTYALIQKMLQSVKDTYKTNQVHIGMDEAHMLGLGKYFDKHGYQNRFDILRRHLEKVCDMAKEMGLEPNIWSDMFFRLGNHGVYSMDKPHIDPEEIGALPEGLNLTYWEYSSKDKKRYRAMFDAHRKITDNLWFAGSARTWKGFCPDNRHSIRTAFPAIDICREYGVENVMMTMWGDNGAECSRFAVIPALFAIAKYAAGEKSLKKIQDEFKKTYGISWREFLNIDLNTTISRERPSNPEKYLLYNDLFQGKMDSTLSGHEKEDYKAYARRLSKCKDHPRFGTLFDTAASLARTLTYKAPLGATTRALYQAGDKDGMKALLKEYSLAIKNLKEFTVKFRRQWMGENKPFGFDVQDSRLGGALVRWEFCRQRLVDWIENDTPIAELEEDALDVRGGGKEFLREPLQTNNYKDYISAGRT